MLEAMLVLVVLSSSDLRALVPFYFYVSYYLFFIEIKVKSDAI